MKAPMVNAGMNASSRGEHARTRDQPSDILCVHRQYAAGYTAAAGRNASGAAMTSTE
ncbi:MAG: hypothetical protein BWX71_01279 [Deltaproteobacteria bacterium ADurb.Bin072]|nr:MAG: hypothetical protein BWX71_01279 [Deltaproteobacteria bacterium ADurb.Bin072]